MLDVGYSVKQPSEKHYRHFIVKLDVGYSVRSSVNADLLLYRRAPCCLRRMKKINYVVKIMVFFSLDVLYAPRLPDLYFW